MIESASGGRTMLGSAVAVDAMGFLLRSRDAA
jgi:hypothetical protein